MDIKKALELIVEDSKSNNLNKPFVQNTNRFGKVIVSTDCKIMMVYKGVKDLGNLYQTLTYPNVETTFFVDGNNLLDLTNEKTMRTSSLREALKKAGKENKTIVIESAKCHECDGTGYVQWKYKDRNGKEYSNEDTCPCCDNGFIAIKYKEIEVYKYNEAVKIEHGIVLSPTVLDKLLRVLDALEIDEFKYFTFVKRKDSVFNRLLIKHSDFIILVMPLNFSDLNDDFRIINIERQWKMKK
ncbi:MAG: hypothetical protein IKR52_08890 [Paludibacteraceae bacterium]|nr:hypothetical protein [Paludibacteraceae bacterium]